MQQEYQELGMAVLRQSCRDLIRFSGARNRREYRSARRFLDSVLFALICRAAGADPDRTRELILRHVESVRVRGARPGRTRVAEERPVYRARWVIGFEAREQGFRGRSALPSKALPPPTGGEIDGRTGIAPTGDAGAQAEHRGGR